MIGEMNVNGGTRSARKGRGGRGERPLWSAGRSLSRYFSARSAFSAVKDVAVFAVLVAACAGRGDPPPSPAPVGVYRAEQAARGRETFRGTCAACHAVAEFRGTDFAWRWRRQTAWDLYDRIATTMPLTDPGGLPAQTYADVVAYILSLNDYPAGTADLTVSEPMMAAIVLGPGGGS